MAAAKEESGVPRPSPDPPPALPPALPWAGLLSSPGAPAVLQPLQGSVAAVTPLGAHTQLPRWPAALGGGVDPPPPWTEWASAATALLCGCWEEGGACSRYKFKKIIF